MFAFIEDAARYRRTNGIRIMCRAVGNQDSSGAARNRRMQRPIPSPLRNRVFRAIACDRSRLLKITVSVPHLSVLGGPRGVPGGSRGVPGDPQGVLGGSLEVLGRHIEIVEKPLVFIRFSSFWRSPRSRKWHKSLQSCSGGPSWRIFSGIFGFV